MKRRAVLICALACLLLGPGVAEAKLSFKRCGGYGFACARLAVPIDRTGAVPGGISLHVKRLRGKGARRPGALFVLAGGPGQSASDAFTAEAAAEFAPAFRGRSLIVYDQRGTGRSGVLRCRRLERANPFRAGDAAKDCARRLGPRRAFYTTRDSVEDIEAVRRELGIDKIDLFAVSYGTKVALGYALRYPAHVGRMALDSVVEANGPDPFYRDTFEAVPRVLGSLCRSRCPGVRDPSGDLERLVTSLDSRPVRGRVFGPGGRGKRSRLDRTHLLAILLAGDYDPAVRADFPAAVRAALDGDPAPILRLKRRTFALDAEVAPARAISSAVYAAASCEETPFPWPRATPPAERHEIASDAAYRQPAEVFRPFDRKTAVNSDLFEMCEPWPTAPAAPTLGPGPLPDVPVLLLEGEDDLRTPVENARRVAAGFPQTKLLVAPGTGHSAYGSDASGCAARALLRFFQGRAVSTRCRRSRREFPPTGVPPRRLSELAPAGRVRGRRGRALTALSLTLSDVADDASVSLLDAISISDLSRGGGLRGGRYRVTSGNTLKLRRLSYVPGVRVSGRLRRFGEGRRQRGRLRISGTATPDGVLRIRGRRVSGRLGGRRVSARLVVRARLSGTSAEASGVRPPPPGLR